jgi:flagellar biosynthesis protein
MALDRQKRLQAVALRFRQGQDAAPRVAAKGSGHVAEKILELARQHYIPIRQDRNLVQVLSLLDLNQEIPPHVYQAVAEILAFVYRLGRPPEPRQGSVP